MLLRGVQPEAEGIGDLLGRRREAVEADVLADPVDDLALARDFLAGMEGQGVDFTQAFRRLADAAEAVDASREGWLRKLYADDTALNTWLPRWRARQNAESVAPAQRGTPVAALALGRLRRTLLRHIRLLTVST